MTKEAAATLGAGDLARLSGVSTDTLRHYERKGLLAQPPRTAAGYRRYPADAVTRVRLIRRALIIGFSLDELASVLRERAAGGAPCRKVRSIVEDKLVNLNQQLADLALLKRDLQTLLNGWDAQLDETPPGERAHLLDALARREDSGLAFDELRPPRAGRGVSTNPSDVLPRHPSVRKPLPSTRRSQP